MDVKTEELRKLEELLKDENYEPTTKELLEMLETSEMDEELRESLRGMLAGHAPQLLGGAGRGTLLAVSLGMIIFCIILFFGYKLYKSIKEKEKKREEKKKLKQMKKKK
ncbi:uncharacterized protein LOC123878993 isoform X2 [Maniola jurtina]|uniref:uncharacterized protein LOC123878993 isoform X2 n=1 Tax=Maniola jurtina TaxID=191418 RepID=UPI001E68CFF1|nr:uncharacterized protein LOC123878993 isoform X2 [Maniola jurtina]